MVNRIAIGAFLPLLILFFLLYQQRKFKCKREDARALVFKGAATLCCAGLAILGAIQSPDAAHWMLAAGLLVCMLADVLLGIRFLVGMGCFALGHVFYCTAYVLFASPRLISLIVFGILSLLLLLVFPWAKKHSGGRNILPFFAYGLVLCLMLALAVLQKPLLLTGAILFVISDLMLGIRMAKGIPGRIYDYLCLGCYYLAQCFIGLSVLF